MLSITRKCFAKMRILCESSYLEVAGMALCKSDIIYGFTLTEYIGNHLIGNDLSDISTKTNVVSDVIKLAQMQKEARKQQGILVDWHSHNSMPAFWSSTDENNIKTFPNEHTLISIVTNHKGEVLIRKDTSYFTGIETRKYPSFALIGKPISNKEANKFKKEVEEYYLKRKE